MIKKVGDKWVLYSKDGSRVLGRFDTKKAAQDREEQIKRIVRLLKRGGEAVGATEQAKKAQLARSRRYGIGIKKGGNVTKPAAYADVPDSMFADPVNYRYPLSPEARAVNAITRFNDSSNRTAGGYTEEEWAKIGRRIARANPGKVYRDGKVVDREQQEANVTDFVDRVRYAFSEFIGEKADGWVREVYDEGYAIVEYEGDTYKAPFKVGGADGDDIIFAPRAEWTKVKLTYTPINETLSFLSEASGGGEPQGAVWEVTIIGPETEDDLVNIDGRQFVRSKNGRYYSVEALKRSVEMWDGVKVYDNHLTPEERQKKAGMRSVVKEWVGTIVKPWWDDKAKAIKAQLRVVDEQVRNKLKNALDVGVLDSIGLSIDALGVGRNGSEGEILIERIVKTVSVDVVADPAAGGRLVRMLASTEAGGIEMEREKLMKLLEELLGEKFAELKEYLEQLTDERLEAFLAGLKGEGEKKEDQKGPESAKAAETEEKPTEVSESVAGVEAQLAQAVQTVEAAVAKIEQERRLMECGKMLSDKLGASGLPEKFRAVIATRFKGRVFEEEELDAEIKAFQEAFTEFVESQPDIPVGALRLGEQFTAWERYEMALLRLVAGQTTFNEIVQKHNEKEVKDYNVQALESYVKAGQPALPRAARLSEWYVDLCGGWDAAIEGRLANPTLLQEANLDTASLTSIIKNTVNILLANDYSQREQWWTPIVRQEDVDTLDDATLVRVYGFNTLSAVSEKQTYTEFDWNDEEETASYVKKGNFVGISLETFLRDKLNVLRTIPRRLADAWYNTVSDLVATVFTCNSAAGPVLSDSGALFNGTALTSAGGHANLGSTALAYASLAAARLAMMKQTDQPLGAGRRLGITPRYLLVPMDLEQTALQIRNSELVPGQSGGASSGGQLQTVNTLRNSFDVIVVPGWTDANDWACVADPRRFPAIWLIWLRGRRTPELYSADNERAGAMFTNDVLRYKVRMFTYQFSSTYTCAPVSDFRPLYKANVS